MRPNKKSAKNAPAASPPTGTAPVITISEAAQPPKGEDGKGTQETLAVPAGTGLDAFTVLAGQSTLTGCASMVPGITMTVAAGAPAAVVVGDPVETPSLFKPRAAEAAQAPATGLAGMDLKALLDLRQRIDEQLPARTIAEMDLEEEAVIQYHRAKVLMNETMSSGAPANQKAQTMNTCAAILRSLAETQSALYDSERAKLIEAAAVRAFTDQPMAVKEAFFKLYTGYIEEFVIQKSKKTS